MFNTNTPLELNIFTFFSSCVILSTCIELFFYADITTVALPCFFFVFSSNTYTSVFYMQIEEMSGAQLKETIETALAHLVTRHPLKTKRY
jgi:hypothetical protein